MGIETGELNQHGFHYEVSEARAREFLRSLPSKGIILHGVHRRHIEGIRNKGLLPSQRDVFYFFLKLAKNPSPDEYSANDTKRIMSHLKGAISECLQYAMFTGISDLPAIVIAKRPLNTKPSYVSRVEETLPIGVSRSIPAKSILDILVLAPREYTEISGGSKDIVFRRELIDIFLKKIIDSLIYRNNERPARNKIKEAISKFWK